MVNGLVPTHYKDSDIQEEACKRLPTVHKQTCRQSIWQCVLCSYADKALETNRIVEATFLYLTTTLGASYRQASWGESWAEGAKYGVYVPRNQIKQLLSVYQIQEG